MHPNPNDDYKWIINNCFHSYLELDDLHCMNASQGMTIHGVNIDKKCKLPNNIKKQLNYMKAFSQLPPTEISKGVCSISRLTDIFILWLCVLIWLEISSLMILPIRLSLTDIFILCLCVLIWLEISSLM